MDTPPDNKQISRKKTSTRIKIDSTAETASNEQIPGTSSQQDHFIPLAARDSEWIGLSFYNPCFQSQQEYDDQDEKELQSIGTDGHENMPIYLMFPKLKDSKIHHLLPGESTTNVTKMLVGHKADFSQIKSTNKKVQLDIKLQAVPESQDEREHFEDAGRSFIPGDSRGNSNQFIPGKRRFEAKALFMTKAEPTTDSDPYDLQSELEDDSPPKHKKRRKRLLDMHNNESCNSSGSDLYIPPKRKSPRLKGHSLVIRSLREFGATSSQENFGDDETDQPKNKQKKCN